MIIAVRKDLKMSKGKIAAQCGHAAVGGSSKAYKHTPTFWHNWSEFGVTKIACWVENEEDMNNLEKEAKESGLVTYKVRDAGYTEVPPNSITVLSVGPAPIEFIDKVTKRLKLIS